MPANHRRPQSRMTQFFYAWLGLQILLWTMVLTVFNSSANATLPTIMSLEEATPQVGERSGINGARNEQRIEQIISRSGRVEIQKVSYPAPGEGEKIVVLPLPKISDGSYDLNAFQVGIKFTIRLNVDPCNRVLLHGEIENQNLTTQAPLSFLRLTYKRAHTQSSLMACTKNNSEVRNVEVTSELANSRKFRENIVLYLPKEVTTTAEVYQRIGIISGQEP